DLAWDSTEGMAATWRSALVARTEERVPALVDALDATIAGTDLGGQRRPRWWRLWSVLGTLLFLTALAGALWLGGPAVLGYLRLPEPPTPRLGPVPWPTALLLGGSAGGLLLALVGRLLARAGGRRTARRAQAQLTQGVGRTATEVVVAPLAAELRRYREFCAAVERASREPGPHRARGEGVSRADVPAGARCPGGCAAAGRRHAPPRSDGRSPGSARG